MRETAESWTSDDFATETVEDIGETTYEERTYYEKVGQEEEEIVVGSHEEKIGTKRVKVGQERVKVVLVLFPSGITRLVGVKQKRFTIM